MSRREFTGNTSHCPLEPKRVVARIKFYDCHYNNDKLKMQPADDL